MGKVDRLYTTWVVMKQRCQNPKHHKYPMYGGRGIKVCKRWNLFQNFLTDMGHPPKPGMQIERKNNNGNYTRSNCRWASRKEQARNRRDNHILEFRGLRACFAEWSERTGIKYDNIKNRINNLRWTTERALTTP